jgi:hypothetical protein
VFIDNDTYRLVNMLTGGECLGRYDSAYDAADALRAALLSENRDADHWCVLGIDGGILLRATDVEL